MSSFAGIASFSMSTAFENCTSCSAASKILRSFWPNAAAAALISVTSSFHLLSNDSPEIGGGPNPESLSFKS
jgi:hypothetical protein